MMKVVEILIKHGADVNAQTHSLETPLHLAARRAHFDVVKMLLKHGAQPRKLTKKGHSPLHYSVSATSTYQEKGLFVRFHFYRKIQNSKRGFSLKVQQDFQLKTIKSLKSPFDRILMKRQP